MSLDKTSVRQNVSSTRASVSTRAAVSTKAKGTNGMSFDGQRVVIIGASAGIGEATAREFAARNAAVTITGRSKERLDEAARRIGYPVDAAEVDATDRGALDAFFAVTGTVDHLVLSASPGAVGAGPIATLDEAAL